jgi:hypothetical protein
MFPSTVTAEYRGPKLGSVGQCGLHSCFSRGSHLLGELFPGLPDEFVVAGAVVVDDGHLSRVYARIGRYSAKFADPRALVFHLAG